MVQNAGKDVVADDPPFSRLFVVYNRNDPLSEEELIEKFGAYGEIQDIFTVNDKQTGNPKGVAYIKFAKMSQAALAMEKLNHQPIKSKSGTFKIYIAKNKGESKSSDDDLYRYLRLFVIVPKTASESDVKLYFSKFGQVRTVKLLRNRDTDESKGIGYVTYGRIYEAAIAVEEGENEEGYKAVISRPKENNPSRVSSYDSHLESSNNSSRSSYKDIQSTEDSFSACVSIKLTKDNIYRLFDVAPGLINIEVVSQNMYRSEIVATYKNAVNAEYASSKLHGLEYPIGEFISIDSKVVTKSKPTPSNSVSGGSYSGSFSDSFGNSWSSGKRKRDHRGEKINYKMDSPSHSSDANEQVTQKLSALSRALTDATALLKSAGLSTEHLNVKMDSNKSRWSHYSSYCEFPVPPTQPILSKSDFDEHTGMRLFFVGHPSCPPVEALYDVYCRFGNFAGASVIGRKNYGYLYFTSSESAYKAIKATDDKMIAGVNIKVLKAEPKKSEPSHKEKGVSNR